MKKRKRNTSTAKKHYSGQTPAKPRADPVIWVAAALDGCQDITRIEVARRLRGTCVPLVHRRRDEIHFVYTGPTDALLGLRTVQSLFIRRDFAIQRPRTLLSPEHLNALAETVQKARSLGQSPPLHGLRFDAAGANSPTMRRLGQALSEKLAMPFDPENGDCLIVLRPGHMGWEVLCRVGDRPLATRAWRQVDYRGSLNAAIAASMIELSQPRRGDCFLNLMCGGGTLLIERHLRQRTHCLVGVDCSREAVAVSRINAQAAGITPELFVADARASGLPTGGFDVVVADLPYGRVHGKREENTHLYEQTLVEASRVCRVGGRSVLISEDFVSLNHALKLEHRRWEVIDERSVVQRSFRPRCVTLRRRG